MIDDPKFTSINCYGGLYIKHFGRKRTESEQEKIEEMMKLLDTFCLKVWNKTASNMNCGIEYLKYLENFGYYALIWDAYAMYSLINYGFNQEEAWKKILIHRFLFQIAGSYEVRNREKLEQDFAKRFENQEYNQCFYFAKQSIQNWDTYYDGDIPLDIIAYYENYLNKVFNEDKENKTWSYNSNTKTFELKEIEKDTDYILSKKQKNRQNIWKN